MKTQEEKMASVIEAIKITIESHTNRITRFKKEIADGTYAFSSMLSDMQTVIRSEAVINTLRLFLDNPENLQVIIETLERDLIRNHIGHGNSDCKEMVREGMVIAWNELKASHIYLTK